MMMNPRRIKEEKGRRKENCWRYYGSGSLIRRLERNPSQSDLEVNNKKRGEKEEETNKLDSVANEQLKKDNLE